MIQADTACDKWLMLPKKHLLNAPFFSMRTGFYSSRTTKETVANQLGPQLVGKTKVMSYDDIVEAQASQERLTISFPSECSLHLVRRYLSL